MEPPIGSNRPYLASSVTEKTLVANSEARLHAILATLEECRAGLLASTSRETAELVSTERPHDPRSPQGQRRRPLLKLVK